MKNNINLFALLMFGVFFLYPSSFFAQTKPKIAVLTLEAKNVSQETADAVADILSTELVNSQRFQVIERQAIVRILEEQKLQMAGVTDMTQAVEIGKVLNVQKIMIGSVSKLGNTYIINARLVDVKTGAMELADKAQSTSGEEGLPTAIADLVRKITQKVAIEGSIIKINGNVVIIDLGENHGLYAREELAVIRVGDAVTDLSGKVIGHSEDILGSVTIVSLKPDYSETGVAKSKTPFRVGDKVRVTDVPVRIEQQLPEPEPIPQTQQTIRRDNQPKKKKPVKRGDPPPAF